MAVTYRDKMLLVFWCALLATIIFNWIALDGTEFWILWGITMVPIVADIWFRYIRKELK